MKAVIDSLEKMANFSANFIDTLRPDIQATVYGLRGDLGAGKTTFVQHVAKKLGVEEEITSPTFVIQKRYDLPEDKKFSYIIHIDAYRLEESKDLTKLDFQTLLEDTQNLIFIEWPEKVAGVLPENIRYIDFRFIDEATREIVYNS